MVQLPDLARSQNDGFAEGRAAVREHRLDLDVATRAALHVQMQAQQFSSGRIEAHRGIANEWPVIVHTLDAEPSRRVARMKQTLTLPTETPT